MESIEGIPEISSITLKNLGDKSYDRRKSSAQEITVVVSKFYVACNAYLIICRKKEMRKNSRKY